MKRIANPSLLFSLMLGAGCVLPGCATPKSGAVRPDGQRGRARAARRDTAPKAGQRAPRFSLRRLGNESQRVKLASFRGKKPVVLFFGSYT